MLDLRHAFPNQSRNEAVFVFARRYWFTFLPTALIFIFVFIFALGFQYVAATSVIGSIATSNLIILVLGIFQLFALTVFMVAVIDFYYDLLIVTDQRLVDIDQEQLFHRKFSQLNLQDIQDASATVSGLFPTLLNYGTVNIQTAGERENFVAPAVRYPNEIAAIISNLAKQAKEEVPSGERFPETTVFAVIDGITYTDRDAFLRTGAILPEDLRLRAE